MKIEKILSEKVKVVGTIAIPSGEKSLEVIHVDGGNQGDLVRPLTPKILGAYNLTTPPEGKTHIIGRLMLTPEEAEAILAVDAELEAHPALIAKNALFYKKEKEIADQEAARIKNGWCTKCESYCFGDCSFG